MVFEGYLAFGGTEVVNSERARGLTRTSDCPPRWLQGPECTTLQDALGDAPYTYENMPLAPWYDPALPDLSGRFFGVYGLSIEGLNASTRSAELTEGIQDGGTLGATRKGARSARVRATLLARGRDALDYGVAWLNAALDPGRCGQHASACGTTDVEFLTECPPERPETQDFTAWADPVANLAMNPRFGVDLTGWAYGGGGGSTGTLERHTGSGLTISDTYATATVVTAGTWYRARLADSSRWSTVTALQTYTLSAWMRSHSPSGATGARVIFTWKNSSNSTMSESSSPNLTIGPEWTRVSLTAVAPEGAVRTGYDFGFITSAVGDAFDVTGVLLQESPTLSSYFDGDTPDTALVQNSWSGAANASTSIRETRTAFMRPATDEEYAELVDPLRRYMHDVAVTSGPIPVAHLKSQEGNGFYGITLEWTITSERAWVYSKTRKVSLPTTTSLIVQDIAYNLVPYPSAELSSGTVVAATNYSTNPSVETNATGWTAVAAGGITSGMLTSGRVSGELAAVGTSSFRVVFTATGAGSTSSVLGSQQEVDISSRPANSRVSVSIWAAELVVSGTVSLGDILVRCYWRSTAGGTILRTDDVGTIPTDGGALSVNGLVPPEGANFVVVQVRGYLNSWNAGTVVRLYTDALAVTVP